MTPANEVGPAFSVDPLSLGIKYSIRDLILTSIIVRELRKCDTSNKANDVSASFCKL